MNSHQLLTEQDILEQPFYTVVHQQQQEEVQAQHKDYRCVNVKKYCPLFFGNVLFYVVVVVVVVAAAAAAAVLCCAVAAVVLCCAVAAAAAAVLCCAVAAVAYAPPLFLRTYLVSFLQNPYS